MRSARAAREAAQADAGAQVRREVAKELAEAQATVKMARAEAKREAEVLVSTGKCEIASALASLEQQQLVKTEVAGLMDMLRSRMSTSSQNDERQHEALQMSLAAAEAAAVAAASRKRPDPREWQFNRVDSAQRALADAQQLISNW